MKRKHAYQRRSVFYNSSAFSYFYRQISYGILKVRKISLWNKKLGKCFLKIFNKISSLLYKEKFLLNSFWRKKVLKFSPSGPAGLIHLFKPHIVSFNSEIFKHIQEYGVYRGQPHAPISVLISKSEKKKKHYDLFSKRNSQIKNCHRYEHSKENVK